MYQILLTILIMVSFLLVVFVLLQSGKGGGLASAFGGAGGTDAILGGRTAATFLSKATTVLGVAFMLGQAILPLTAKQTPKSAVQEELQSEQQAEQPIPITVPPVQSIPSESKNLPLTTGESDKEQTADQSAGGESPAQPESVGVKQN